MTNFSLSKLPKIFASPLMYASFARLSKASSVSIVGDSATGLETLVPFWASTPLSVKQAAAINAKVKKLFGFIIFFLVEEVLSGGNRGIASNDKELSHRSGSEAAIRLKLY
jgi:hypothetical protein